MGKEQYSQNNLRWPAAATARTSARLPLSCSTPTHLVLRFRSSRARLRLISCPAAQPPLISCSSSAHLVLGFGSSRARLLRPPLISCSSSAHLVFGFGSSRARVPLISCSTLAHLVFGFGSSRARLLSLGQTMSASSSATHCLMKAIIHRKVLSSHPIPRILAPNSLLFTSPLHG
jgi:hypothetical protein